MIPLSHGLDLPEGVLLDDHLPQDVRADLDREALTRLADWRRGADPALTFDGACVPHVWEVELLAEVQQLVPRDDAVLASDQVPDSLLLKLSPRHTG